MVLLTSGANAHGKIAVYVVAKATTHKAPEFFRGAQSRNLQKRLIFPWRGAVAAFLFAKCRGRPGATCLSRPLRLGGACHGAHLPEFCYAQQCAVDAHRAADGSRGIRAAAVRSVCCEREGLLRGGYRRGGPARRAWAAVEDRKERRAREPRGI